MASNMQIILQEMGWNDGYHIPVANEENQKLEAEVERLTLAKAKAAFTLETLTAKCAALDKHMKYVNAERERNQSLLTALQSQEESEKTLYHLAKNEKDRLTHEMTNFDKEMEKVETRKQEKLTTLNNLVAKIDKIKIAIEWDEQTIEEWDAILRKKEDDNEVIRRFSEEDKKKLKELELKRSRLQEDEYAKRQLMIRTSNELESMELILARNVQLYKKRHDERNGLIRQWQEAVKHAKHREKEILSISGDILSTKELNKAKLEVLEQEKQFYNNELKNNKEIKAKVFTRDKELAKKRKKLSEVTAELHEYLNEEGIRSNQRKKMAEDLQKERLNEKLLRKEYEQKVKTLNELKEQIEGLREQEKNVRQSKNTANERIKVLEDILKSEEHVEKSLLIDIEHSQDKIFREQQSLTEITESNKIDMQEKNILEEELSSLRREKEQLQQELLVQKEELYKLKYKFTMIQSKLSRMNNGGEEDGPEDNEEKIEDLEQSRKEETELNNLLKAQVKNLEEVLHNLTNSITADNEKLSTMKDKLKNQLLTIDSAEKEIAEIKKSTQHSQVEENLIKVQLAHAQKTLKQEGNQLYSLQRQQLELETLMKERQSEILMNKEIFNAKKMALCEDQHRLKLDIQERQVKIDHLKKRYDCTIATVGQTEEGDTVSVAYFQVKTAQEKYMLQEEGDKLDGQIQKAEKEIIAMENTLKAVNVTNKTFQKSLSLVDENDEELTEMKQIEDELYEQAKALRQEKGKLAAKEKQLEELQETFEVVNTKLDELKSQLSERENEYARVEKERENIKNRVQRADAQFKKMIAGKTIDKNLAKDIYVKQLKVGNQAVLQDLSEICVRYLETEPTIRRYLTENQLSLTLPSPKSSSHSSSSNICQSSSSRSGESIAAVTLTLDIPK